MELRDCVEKNKTVARLYRYDAQSIRTWLTAAEGHFVGRVTLPLLKQTHTASVVSSETH